MLQRGLIAFGLGVTLLAFALPAAAQRNADLLRTGRDQYENLQYDEAIQTFSAAIIRRGNSREQELQIYELLGLSYLALNRNDEAEGAFRLVLARDPAHALDRDLAPRILEFFAGVKQRWEAEGRPGVGGTGSTGGMAAQPVTIEHRSPPQQERGHVIELSCSVTDPARRASGVVLAYRTGSRGLFRRLNTAVAGPNFTATIPGSEVRPPVVEYYLEAVDANGIAVAARGDAFAPLRVVVPAGQGLAIHTRWWFWTGLAVLVAGAATATYFIVADNTAEPAHLTLTIRP